MAISYIKITFPDGATAQGVLPSEFEGSDRSLQWSGEAASRIPARLRLAAPCHLEMLLSQCLPDVSFTIQHTGWWMAQDDVFQSGSLSRHGK